MGAGPDGRKCKTCFFYDRIDATSGLCRSAIPLCIGFPAIPPVPAAPALWPTVEKDDWCGHWTPRPGA
jgi:hypothetical protein